VWEQKSRLLRKINVKEDRKKRTGKKGKDACNYWQGGRGERARKKKKKRECCNIGEKNGHHGEGTVAITKGGGRNGGK